MHLEIGKQTKPKTRIRKEILKIRREINEMENIKIEKKTIKQKLGSLKKINQVSKPLARWTNKKREDKLLKPKGNLYG